MKKAFHRYEMFKCVALFFLVFLNSTLFSQKSTAELISTIQPPQSRVEFTDGARSVTISGDYLFITNFWAGLQVVDISDIKNPQQIAYLPTHDQAYNTAVDESYAYLANNSSGVQVYDLRDKNNIRRVAQIKLPGNAFGVTADASGLFVAMGDSGFAIIDLADLDNPQINHIRTPGVWVQQIVKRENLLYLAAKLNGVLIYDLSGVAAPRQISKFRTGYNTMMVQVEDDIAYIADGPGGLLTLNISNPAFPVMADRFNPGGFVGNLYKSGSYAYLANRKTGLQIVNVNDSKKLFFDGEYQTDDISYGVVKKDVYVFLAANRETEILRHNNAPQLKALENMQLPENAPFVIQLEATEPDGDDFEYQAFNLPEGATFDAQTGRFSWTPTYEQSGDYENLVFRIKEHTESQLTASDTISLTVAHVNRLPDLPTPENATVAENAELKFTLVAGSDPDREDQDRLSYRAEKLPEGAAFDPETRTFSWTPNYEQSGRYTVDFILDDGAGGIDREPVNITVEHVDRKPVIEAIAAQSINEAQLLSLTLTGADPDREDQDKISFQMKNLPDGAAFDPATRVFNWTPTYDQSGTYENIRAIMIAGNLSDTTTFSITVNHINRPPQLAAIADQAMDENQPLTFTIAGSDPDTEDAGKLTFTAENLPDGATFDAANRTFQWTPTYEQSGQYADVRFSVADPAGLIDSKAVTIVVNHVNRPPSIVAVSDQNINENALLEFQLSASDPDREDAGKLIFSANSLPDGASLDAKTGEFHWTPSYEQSGQYPLIFSVTDGQFSDSTSLKVSVAHVNRPPVMSEILPQSTDENQALQFTVEGSDPDREDAGALTFAAQNLPDGATFDAVTHTFQWSPTFEQSGEYEVTFVVNDPSHASDRQTVKITVNHVNRPPTLAAISAQTVDENQPLAVQLNGSDPDREDARKLRYAIENLPAGATLDPATGAFSWTPAFDQSGHYQLTATVSDPGGFSATQPFAVSVNNVNRPPKFSAVNAQNGDENALLQSTISANDPDAEDAGKLIYSATNLPDGATVDPASGTVSWTPTYNQSGRYTVMLKVTDTHGASAETDVPIVIRHVNRPPTLPAVGNQELSEDESWQMTLPEGADPDREDTGKLSYRIEPLPGGANFDATSRTLSWHPNFEQAGDYAVSYVIGDGNTETRQSFTLQVKNVNRSPEIQTPGNQTGKAGQPIRFRVSANDPDKEDAGKLQFQADGLPDGATFDETSGEFNWTPDSTQQGTYTISFSVKDTGGLSDSTSISIEVEDVSPENSGNGTPDETPFRRLH